jgi:hypothetical protein
MSEFKSTKLSELKRNRILQKMVADIFKKRIEDLQKRKCQLATDVLEHELGIYKKQFEELPPEFFKKSMSMSVRFGVGSYDLVLKEERSIPYHLRSRNYNYGECIHIPEDSVLYSTWNTFINDEKNLEEDRNDFKVNAKAILNSANSTGQLLKVWPEAEPYIESGVVNTETMALVDMTKLNNYLKSAE